MSLGIEVNGIKLHNIKNGRDLLPRAEKQTRLFRGYLANPDSIPDTWYLGDDFYKLKSDPDPADTRMPDFCNRVGPYGLREDGSEKGYGFFGAFVQVDFIHDTVKQLAPRLFGYPATPTSYDSVLINDCSASYGDSIRTEVPIKIEIHGEEILVPALVPSLIPAEIMLLLTNEDENEIPGTIIDKVVKHAKYRFSMGRSPFYQTLEGYIVKKDDDTIDFAHTLYNLETVWRIDRPSRQVGHDDDVLLYLVYISYLASLYLRHLGLPEIPILTPPPLIPEGKTNG